MADYLQHIMSHTRYSYSSKKYGWWKSLLASDYHTSWRIIQCLKSL